MSKKTAIGVGVLLVGLCVFGRMIDHVPNFTPLAAAALFAGFLFSRRLVAVIVILAAMVVSDIFIGTYHFGVMLTVYAALLFPVALRSVLKKQLTAPRVVGCALLSSVVFFLVTNFAHWLFMGMYPQTLAGLLTGYAAALPFFKFQLAGDLFWSAILFGGYALSCRCLPLLQLQAKRRVHASH